MRCAERKGGGKAAGYPRPPPRGDIHPTCCEDKTTLVSVLLALPPIIAQLYGAGLRAEMGGLRGA